MCISLIVTTRWSFYRPVHWHCTVKESSIVKVRRFFSMASIYHAITIDTVYREGHFYCFCAFTVSTLFPHFFLAEIYKLKQKQKIKTEQLFKMKWNQHEKYLAIFKCKKYSSVKLIFEILKFKFFILFYFKSNPNFFIQNYFCIKRNIIYWK